MEGCQDTLCSLPFHGADSPYLLYLPWATIQMRLLLQGLVQAGGRKGTWKAQGRWENSFLSRLNQFWFTQPQPPQEQLRDKNTKKERDGLVCTLVAPRRVSRTHVCIMAQAPPRAPVTMRDTLQEGGLGWGQGLLLKQGAAGLQPILMGPVSQVPTVPWKE